MITRPDIIRLPAGSGDCPRRVSAFLNKAPALSLMGNKRLLEHEHAVGICGSRKALPDSIAAAENCIKQLVSKRSDIVIVSGNAAGIDLEAHYTALREGAGTILALPEGINQFKIRKKLQPVWSWEKALVISQFPDNAVWKSWQAMARNKLILALSKAMIVIEAGATGGTKAAADSAIAGNVPLFAINYQSNPEGNESLINQHQGMPIHKNRKTNQANITPILNALAEKNSEFERGNSLFQH